MEKYPHVYTLLLDVVIEHDDIFTFSLQPSSEKIPATYVQLQCLFILFINWGYGVFMDLWGLRY